MSYSEQLADRVRVALGRRRNLTEQRMFGGLCFLINKKMVAGITEDRLMLRISPGDYEAALAKPYVKPMDFTGRPMKGFIYIDRKGLATSTQLKKWLEQAINYVKTLPTKK